MGCAPWPRPAATPRTGGAEGPPAEPERTSFGLQSYPDFIPEHPRESTPALARVGGCANPTCFSSAACLIRHLIKHKGHKGHKGKRTGRFSAVTPNRKPL